MGKFYAVRIGKVPGVYTNWNDCKEQVHGFPGATFKSFENEKDAKAFLENKNTEEKVEQCTPEVGEVFAYVDGSFKKETNEYAYGVVIIDSNGEQKTFSGKDNKNGVVSMKNVAGELKGVMIATQYVIKEMPEVNTLRIFHDYEGIAKWVTGDWRTNLEYTTKYKEYMLKMKEKIQIEFEKVTAHTGVKYNEMADKLAKEVLGIK